MNVTEQILEYITSQPAEKRKDLQTLHAFMLEIMPNCKLWFLDGKDAKGKIVSNPNIGYGFHAIKYTGGKTRDFYQIGLSANTTGVSVYIMGIEDKKYLLNTYGKKIGKAIVSGYCIKFRALSDINTDVLKTVIQDALKMI